MSDPVQLGQHPPAGLVLALERLRRMRPAPQARVEVLGPEERRELISRKDSPVNAGTLPLD